MACEKEEAACNVIPALARILLVPSHGWARTPQTGNEETRVRKTYCDIRE